MKENSKMKDTILKGSRDKELEENKEKWDLNKDEE